MTIANNNAQRRSFGGHVLRLLECTWIPVVRAVGPTAQRLVNRIDQHWPWVLAVMFVAKSAK